MRRTPRKPSRWSQFILLYLGVINAFPGAWALGSPHSFYDSFPGLGHAWVAMDGPYNQHLIRDVGAFFLALSVLCFRTAFQRLAVKSTALCLLTFNVPHLVYHLVHLSMLPPMDQLGNGVALSVNVLLALLLLRLGDGPRTASPIH